MEKIKGPDYHVIYDPTAKKIVWSGTTKLREDRYDTISELLAKAADSKPAELTVDLRELKFLNSGGIIVLSRFLLDIRGSQTIHITIRANQSHTWQRKTLPNLQRMMAAVKMDLIWE